MLQGIPNTDFCAVRLNPRSMTFKTKKENAIYYPKALHNSYRSLPVLPKSAGVDSPFISSGSRPVPFIPAGTDLPWISPAVTGPRLDLGGRYRGSKWIFLLRWRRRKIIARPTSSEIPRAAPIPIPALAELLNPEAALFGVGIADEVDCFEDNDPVCDTEAAEAGAPLCNDLVEVKAVETVALDDEVVLKGMLNPASA